MKRIVYLLFVIGLLACSGCGAFRKVFKSKQYSILTSQTETKRDSVGLTIDKTITTIKEQADTVINVPGKVVQQPVYLNKDSLVSGIMAIQSDLVDVQLTLDPLTGILTTKATLHPQLIPIKFDRTIIKANDITSSSNVKGMSKASNKHEEGSSIVDKDPIHIPWWTWLIGFLVVGASIWYWKR